MNSNTSSPATRVIAPRAATGSMSCCAHSIAMALLTAESEIGANRVWRIPRGGNPVAGRIREQLIAQLPNLKADLGSIGDCAKGLCSRDIASLNDFLAENGFSPAFSRPLSRLELGAVGIIDILVKWVTAGTVTDIRGVDGKLYPGVMMKGATVFTSRRHNRPIARLDTQNGWQVFLTVEDAPASYFDLLILTGAVSKGLADSQDFEGVRFPMVSMDMRPDVSWLTGLNTSDEECQPVEITKAIQQNKLRMNRFGARAQSATSLVMMRAMTGAKPALTIDAPFLVWFQKAGLSLPAFAAWVNYGDWKDPGGIDTP